MALVSGFMQTFNTQCDIPEHNITVNYVTSPNTRGSLDIVWTCFATLIACVYSVLHFNVPPRTEDTREVKDPKQKKVLAIWQWFRQHRWIELAFWCIVTIFIPEIVYTSALIEFIHAQEQLHQLQTLLREGKKFEPDELKRQQMANRWTLAHMFYANMGGFIVLHEPSPDDIAKATQESTSARFIIKSTTTGHSLREATARYWVKDDTTRGRSPHPSQSRGRATEGTSSPRPGSPSSTALPPPPPEPVSRYVSKVDKQGRAKQDENLISMRSSDVYHRYHLNAPVLRQAIQENLIPPEAVPEDEIKDQAKTDWFAKLLVILQGGAFFVGVVARLVEDLPITALEVVVSAFAICSTIPYLVQWHKPRNVTTTITLATYHQLPDKIRDYKDKSKNFGLRDIKGLRKNFKALASVPVPDFVRKMGDEWRPPPAIDPPVREHRIDKYWIILLCWGGTLFGAIHLAAWRVGFPSVVDVWLWRSSAMATTGLPLVWGCISFVRFAFDSRKDKKATEAAHEYSRRDLDIEKGSKAPTDSKSDVADILKDPKGPPESKSTDALKKGQVQGQKESVTILERLWHVLFFFGLAVYVVGRLILVVEMIRELFFLPPRAFREPHWLAGIPHIN